MSDLSNSRWAVPSRSQPYDNLLLDYSDPPKVETPKPIIPRSKSQSWSIKSEDVETDLTEGQGRPKWILATYGPGSRGSVPASLFEGNEYSFEEMRLRYYELANNNQQAQADQEAQALWSKAENDMKAVRNNSRDVISFMEAADKKHPNRFDFCAMSGQISREDFIKTFESSNTSSAFGQPARAANPFGQPQSTFGAPSNLSGFGQSAFGQPSQPSAFGKPTSTFGTASASSAFGKPAFSSSGFGGGATFGQLGQPAQPAPAFGQPSQPISTFGQPTRPSSAFGQPAQPSAFGQPTQPASAFGQPARPPGFGSTGFGQPAAKNSFAAPSAASGFGQAAPASSVFGQPSAPTPALGQPPVASAFGQPAQVTSPFGAAPQTSAFGQPSQPTSTFGQPSQPSSGFGQPSSGSVFGQASNPLNAGSTTMSDASTIVTPTNPFDQPQKSSLFGSQPTTTTTPPPFGQPAQPATGPSFGQPNPLASSPFGRASSSNQIISENPFAKPVSTSTSAAASTGLANTNSSTIPHPLTGKPAHPLHYTQTLPSQQATQKNSSTKEVTSYKGLRVTYVNDVPTYDRPDGKGKERIWFPDGRAEPDVAALSNVVGDLQVADEEYMDEVKEQYKTLFKTGKFEPGKFPKVPPKQEWCDFDF